MEQEPADSLYEALRMMRAMREDVSDGVWRDGLRVVMSSVRNHSTMAPGDKGYLRFISSFL